MAIGHCSSMIRRRRNWHEQTKAEVARMAQRRNWKRDRCFKLDLGRHFHTLFHVPLLVAAASRHRNRKARHSGGVFCAEFGPDDSQRGLSFCIRAAKFMRALQGLSNGEADLAFALGDTGGAEDVAHAEWKKLLVTRLLFGEFGMSDQNTDALKRERAFPDGPGELMPTLLFIVAKARCFGTARAGYEGEAGHCFNPEAVGSALSADEAVVILCLQLSLGFVLLV